MQVGLENSTECANRKPSTTPAVTVRVPAGVVDGGGNQIAEIHSRVSLPVPPNR